MQDVLMDPASGRVGEGVEAASAPARAQRGFGDRLFRAVELVLALGFIGAVLLNVANVFGRYVLGQSMIAAEELETYVMVAMTFLGAAVIAWRGRELRMDVLIHALPARGRGAVRKLELLVSIAVCGFTAWQSTRYALQMYELGVQSEGADVPMWIPHGLVALGLVAITVIATFALAHELRPGGSRSHVADPSSRISL